MMLNCWDENPSNRASFTDLRKQFDAMLSSMTSKVSVLSLRVNVTFPPIAGRAASARQYSSLGSSLKTDNIIVITSTFTNKRASQA